eukprot:SM000007S20925  [mRNA]  locus=s7:1084933:1086636:+ [translate_table: standard]
MLAPFVGDERRARIAEVAAGRTYSVLPVVEGLVDLGNIGAVCRTAEALGCQGLHVIDTARNQRFKKNRSVSMGSDKWLDVELWEGTECCIRSLRARGYRIAVTLIAPDSVPIYDMDWTIPTAVILGNEKEGVSDKAVQLSDVRCSIPIGGMVDSFNISVAAGIILHHAARSRIAQQGFHGDLTEVQREILTAELLLRHSRQTGDILLRLVSPDRNVRVNTAGQQSRFANFFREELARSCD